MISSDLNAVKTAHPEDIQHLAKVLTNAFAGDPVLRWILPTSTDYERSAEPFFNLILRQGLETGVGLTNQAKIGVSLWEQPGQHHSLLSQLVSFLQMASILRGHLNRALKLQSFMHSYRPQKPHWYLTYIATAPNHQGTGIGRNLLQPMIDKARSDKKPIYLECSAQNNLSFYRAHQFRLVDQIALPHGPTIWPMILDV